MPLTGVIFSMTIADSFKLPSGQIFQNHIAKAAMTEGLAGRDGVPNEDHVRLYRRWAAGKLGLSITGNVQIDRRHLERPGNVVVDAPLTADAKAAWARWASQAGAPISSVMALAMSSKRFMYSATPEKRAK